MPRTDKGKAHNYPTIRKKRTHRKNRIGLTYKTKHNNLMSEMMIKLNGYAPPHSYIYTVTYNASRRNKYQYIDIYCVNNSRLFKITKICAYIMGNTIVKSVINLKSHEMMGIETGNIFNMSSRHELVKVESDFIRRLSKKMFDDEDAYNHESLLSMESHFEKSIEKIENQTKKSYIVRS